MAPYRYRNNNTVHAIQFRTISVLGDAAADGAPGPAAAIEAADLAAEAAAVAA